MKNRPFRRISRPQVLQSAAGYYIGRLWHETETEAEPYDRLSTYYATKEAAERALENQDWIENLN